MNKSNRITNYHRNLWVGFLFIVMAFCAGAADYNITVNAGTNEGWVPYTMFGANFVIGKNDFDANWKSVFESCGMKVIRYPGGGVTEKGFDYVTNAPYMTDILLYCGENNIKPVFVIPTYQFKNNPTAAAAYAENFVKYVNETLHNTYGTPRVIRWELGNEYYQELTPQQYVNIANAQAAAIVSYDPDLEPIVFFKRDRLDETEIIGADLNLAYVKACSTHVYPGDSQDVESVIPSQLLDGAETLGFSVADYVTEWNVANDGTNYPSGMALADRHVAIFKSLVESGVSYAMLWPLMWNPNTVDDALAKYNGAIRPQGQAYQWLQQSARGTWMVNSSDDSAILDSAAFKYMQTNRLSILVEGYSLPTNSSVCLTVNGFNFNSTNGVSAKRMYAPTGDVYDNNTAAGIDNVSPAVFDSGTKLSFTINKKSKYEIIKIDLTP